MSMQQRLFCGLILAMSNFALAVGPTGANTFGAIENWTGSGANQAAIVLDWHNGETNSAMAWGVRFDGSITADAAIRQILASDSRVFGAVSGSGLWLAFGYDADNAGTQGLNAPAGASNPYTPTNGLITYTEAGSLPGSTPLDANDYYGGDSLVTSESWGVYVPDTTTYDDKGTTSGPNYWADDDGLIGASATYTGVNFASAFQGLGTLYLQDESWVGLSFGTYDAFWAHEVAPSAGAPMPASVPEPMTMSLLALGSFGLLRRRKAKK